MLGLRYWVLGIRLGYVRIRIRVRVSLMTAGCWGPTERGGDDLLEELMHSGGRLHVGLNAVKDPVHLLLRRPAAEALPRPCSVEPAQQGSLRHCQPCASRLGCQHRASQIGFPSAELQWQSLELEHGNGTASRVTARIHRSIVESH